MLCDRPLHALRNRMCEWRDQRICGVSLEESVASPFSDTHGAVDTISTPYGTLKAVLGNENFSKDDAFLDVGCGKGRPLAYMYSAGFPGTLTGVEINPPVAQFAQQWVSECKAPIRIACADVFSYDIAPYNVFFIWYSLLPDAFARFVQKMESELTRPARLYHLSDEHGGDFPEGRPGWTLERRGWVYRIHGIPQHGKPQRYSIWRYVP